MFHISQTKEAWLLPTVELHEKVNVTFRIGMTLKLRSEQREASDTMLLAECSQGGFFALEKSVHLRFSILTAACTLRRGSCLRLSEIRRLWKLAQSVGRNGQRGPEGNCPAFKPPFDIIHRIAQKAKQAASDLPTAVNDPVAGSPAAQVR